MVLRKEITTRIKDLLKKNPQGLSITEIVGATSINRNTAGRYLENLLVSGQVEMRRFGMAKIYMLSQRVPLSAVLSISSELVLQLDSNLRIIFTNEPFLDLIGTDEKEILGKNIEYTPIVTVFDDIFPWFITKVREGLNGKEASGDISLPLKDLVFFFRIAPTVFEDGRKGVSVILEDITEQRRADDALRESEDRYRKLVEISPDAVFLHREGRILYANPAAFRLLGASHSDEIIGKNILDFVPPAFQDPVRNNIQKDLEGQTSPRIELPMFRIDGTTIMVEGRGIATVSDGKPAVQVAIRDITEQKQAEEALKIKERQLFSIYSNVPDALFYLSVEPGYRFRFLTVNQSFLNKVHMSEDQVVGKYVDEVIPEPLFSRARGKCIQAIREKKTIHWEEVQEYPNARRYGDAHVTAVFDESGRPTNIIGSVHDTTEHKQLEGSLLESEGKLNAMLRSIADPMSMMDENLTVLWANEPAKRYFGKDITGKKCYEAFHLRQAPCEPYPCFALEAFNDGKTHQHDITITDCQGIRRFFECSVNVALRDDSGKPVAVLEISRDITDRRKAEEGLRKSEGLYRTLAESSNDLIFVIGRDDRLEYVNGYASALVSKPVDQIIGHPSSLLFPPDVARNQIKALEKVFETGSPVRNEGSLTFAGRLHWFDHYLTPLKDTDGCVRSVLGISRDITERKNAENLQRSSDERLRLLLDSTEDLILMQDPEGRYLYFNSSGRYGISGEKMVGSTPYDILDTESADRSVERVKNIVRTGRSIREETPVTWNGQKLWFSDSLSPVRDAKGTITGVVTISQNITERKRAEIALRESEATARALLNAPTDSVILLDDRGIVLALNEIAASRFGKRSADLVGVMSYDLLPKEVAQLRRALMAPVLEKKESVRFVDERAGRWYDTVAYPILNDAGDVKKIAIIARDITEQKNSEKQLRESEQMYRLLLEQSFDAIAIHKEGKIAFLNERAAKILGAARPEDLTGRSISDFIHPESRKDLQNRIGKLSTAPGNSVPVITEKFFRTDRTTVTVEVMAISFNDNGIPAFRVAFREAGAQ